MVRIPAGQFVMGDDAGFSANEKPAVAVTIPRPFLLGRTEVTFDQWQACVDAGACRGGQDDHAWGRGAHPIINITLDDANAFAAWTGQVSGLSCRLPSEAEWEYAARAGTATAFWWGSSAGMGLANCRDCLGKAVPYGTKPVASFAANPFGLYDMNGNVWEWTADCWARGHDGTPTDGSPRGGDDNACRQRVVKGGSWYYFSAMSRPAARAANDSQGWSYNIGLRVLCEVPR
jgi:formylglycine-generating enzyme required for sulfatase activity